MIFIACFVNFFEQIFKIASGKFLCASPIPWNAFLYSFVFINNKTYSTLSNIHFFPRLTLLDCIVWRIKSNLNAKQLGRYLGFSFIGSHEVVNNAYKCLNIIITRNNDVCMYQILYIWINSVLYDYQNPATKPIISVIYW